MIRLTELSPHACRGDLVLREALARLNGSPHLFQVVVDADGRAIGTLTDGDVRRALLAGIGLDAPTERAMRANPTFGRLGEDAANLARLRGIGATLAFLPILGADGRLAEIWIASQEDLSPGAALVMAGGFGRRLGERTRDVPKPLLQVGGRPILDQVIDAVRAAGFDRVHVAVHYLAEMVERHLASRPDAARLTPLREQTPLGTAGAIAMVPGRERDNLLVINADLITRVDLAALIAFHRHHRHEATIATAQHETQIPFGVVRHDEAGRVQGIDEKPVLRDFVMAGIYYLSPRITALVPPDRPSDMPDLINRACAAGLSTGMFPLHEYWRDIGRPADLERAESDHPALAPLPNQHVVKGSA